MCGCLTHGDRQLPWTTVGPPLRAVGVVPWLPRCGALGIHHTLRCILVARLPCEANRGYHVLCVYTLHCLYVSSFHRAAGYDQKLSLEGKLILNGQDISHIRVWVQALRNFGSGFWPSPMYGSSELLQHRIVRRCVPHLLPVFLADW